MSGSRKGHQRAPGSSGLRRAVHTGGRDHRHRPPQQNSQAHRALSPGDELAASATLATVRHPASTLCLRPARPQPHRQRHEQIQLGKQDIVFAGGHEDLDWSMSNLFDAMGAMSSNFNDTPQTASRAYDKDRDGFVIAGGAGVLVLEELEHARARGANILGEIVGYGATSDGFDMVAPSGEGAALHEDGAETVREKTISTRTQSTVGTRRKSRCCARSSAMRTSARPFRPPSRLSGIRWAQRRAECIYSLLMMKHRSSAKATSKRRP